MEDELGVFCAPTHPLAGKAAVDAADLDNQPWILRERGSGTRRQFDRSIGAHLAGFRLRLELEHTEAIKRAVESGLGIGCLSRLVELPTPAFDLRRSFYIVSHALRHTGRAGQVFRELCLRIRGDARHTADLKMPFIP